MAGSVNKVILVGNVGKDPEIKHLNNGNKIANFSLATSDTWKDKQTGERKEKTEWHRVVVYNERIAEVLEQYVKKGHKLYVEGALQTRKWTDQSGAEKYSTEVVIQAYQGSITMLEGRRDGGGRDHGDGYDEETANRNARSSTRNHQAPPNGGSRSGGSKPSSFDDEIPF